MINILKPNQSGHGILIEHDAGYISPNDNKEFISEIKKLDEGKKIITDPLVLYAVLQKSGVKNRNGRIYPREILEREAKNYQTVIKEKRALGECVPAGTKIYTSSGWKNIEDVQIGEEIFTLNISNNKLEKQFVTNTIKKIYNDQMIRIKNNSNLDMLVTKNHKIVLWDRNDKPFILTANELHNKIQNKDSKISHSYIKHSGDWVGNDDEFFVLPGSDIKIDSSDWAAFLGIFISEGHTSGSKSKKFKGNKVVITQVKEDSKIKIKELLDRLPFKYSLYDNRQFTINNKFLYEHLKVLGDSKNKFIPDYAKDWSPRLLNILLDWLLLGDGRNRKNRHNKLIKEYVTTSNRLSDDVFEIMLKLGGGTQSKITPKDRYIQNRLISKDNSQPLYNIYKRETKGIYLDTRFTTSEYVDFNDYVYCVTVPNSTWLMKYNNKISWTHNCDHPESSIISIDRISHNITEIWWQGNTLVGKLEIIMSPGFINQGIISCRGDQIANLIRNGVMIGVSSRGVGTLQKVNGENVVQDDFELICWDVVTSPSTPGSWIFNQKEEYAPFVESKTHKKPLIIDSLDDFLKD